MNKKVIIIIILLLAGGIYYLFSPNDNGPSKELALCPDEWIRDEMPGDPPEEYFVVDGERRELAEFDMDWVNDNCGLEKQTVY